MTLAFSLAAVKRLARPGEAFADAQAWSSHVGIVSDDPRAAQRYADAHDLPQEFFTGDHGIRASLALLDEQFETDRHVFVGTTDDDRRIGTDAEWEYLSVEDAAAKAGWSLVTSDGLRARIRRFFERLG